MYNVEDVRLAAPLFTSDINTCFTDVTGMLDARDVLFNY